MKLAALQKELLAFQKKAKPQELNELKTFIADAFFELHEHKDDKAEVQDKIATLHEIAAEIRPLVNIAGNFKTDKEIWPAHGEFSEMNPETTAVYDDFLYPDEVLDPLMDAGEAKCYHCNACGSNDTVPLDIISHSASAVQLAAIFRFVLPAALFPNDMVITGAMRAAMGRMTLVDIGSRLGPVLYAAHELTDIGTIVGVEIDERYNNLVNTVAKRRGLGRISTVTADVTTAAAAPVLEGADVVFIHNVFDFFVSPDAIQSAWRATLTNLRRAKKGTLILAKPALHTMLENSGMPEEAVTKELEFVEEVDVSQAADVAVAELGLDGLEIFFYRIK